MQKRQTKQKQYILDTVRDLKIHPTADQIYLQVRKMHPNISKGTVYRNLTVLSLDGLIRRVPVPNGAERFDFRLDDHYHIICVGCGKVIDSDIEYNKIIETEIEAHSNFSIVGHDIVFRGYCSSCKKQLPSIKN